MLARIPIQIKILLLFLFWGGLALLFHLLRFDPYGIDEPAARALLLNWTVADHVVNPIVVFGLPDLRPLIAYGVSPRATIYLSIASRARAFLVRGIDVGMQEADRHRLDRVLPQHQHQRIERGLIQLQQQRAVGGQPFRHFQPQVAFFAGTSGIGPSGSLVRGCGKAGVAAPAASALRHQKTLACGVKINQLVSGEAVKNHGPNGDLEHHVCAVLVVTV